MRNNESLYFDIWRKKDFTSLLQVYTQTAKVYETKENMIKGFGDMLDKYMEGGRNTYNGTKKQWSSAYTLGRELGVFRSKIGERYELSYLAKAYLESKILAKEYLFIYLINFNQLIDGKIVHPLQEVLEVIKENEGHITKIEVIGIENFKLYKKKEANQRQIANILLYRMKEAGILEVDSNRDTYKLKDKYFTDIDNLIRNCNVIKASPEEFEQMSHEAFTDLLSTPTVLVPTYKRSSVNNE